ncbi:hypothetical protein BN12_100025 [Nostocoides japonicum T1-X7]|uniref:Uncharacterized protein n=1 Tax=Nostocoides japonicum T1-X7 TaxID=1194083 RepID=A0A077LSX4_9MICO|nr:hypothetical protein BN12_100025 [Tetrasphaera japonica T1-X7]
MACVCAGQRIGRILDDTPRRQIESPLVVFVRKVPGWPGSTKVHLAQRRAGRDVVLQHLRTTRSETVSAMLVAEAARRLRPGQGALNLGLAGGAGHDAIRGDHRRAVGVVMAGPDCGAHPAGVRRRRRCRTLPAGPGADH